MTTHATTMTIQSSAFGDGGPIARKFSGEGDNASPPLSWSRPPPEAKEIVLIADDPDAPTDSPFVHWVIYNIPASTIGLSPRVETSPTPRDVKGAAQGKNDTGTVGYTGPMPPRGHGVHHYHFHIFAVDELMSLRPGLTKDQVLEAIEGHVVAQGRLTGTYERK